MNEQKPVFKSSAKLVKEGIAVYKKYREGILQPVRFRVDHMNNALMGGAVLGDVVTIGATSGAGKTHEYETIKEDFFNKTLNPLCDDYHILESNFEMSMFKMIIRAAKRETGMLGRDILKPSESQKDRVNDAIIKVKADLSHPQIDVLEQVVNPDQWELALKEAYDRLGLSERKCVLVVIDHIALLEKLGSAKATIDRMVFLINRLKKTHPNLIFLILTQLNREIDNRHDVRDLAPRKNDIYQSDTVYHLSDMLVVKQIPQKRGHERYMVVANPNSTNINDTSKRPKRYSYIEEHMVSSPNATTNFDTYNRVFYHYLKMRNDDMAHQDIHIELYNKTLDMNFDDESVGNLPTNAPNRGNQQRIQGM